MEKFKKIGKEFLLSDSSLNTYSYRLMTAGYQLQEFKKNPIGYYLHGTTKEHPREQGVLVKWDDLRCDGDRVYGKPCINLSHPRAARTIDEVENGFLNAASVGHLVALEISKDPKDYLPGQTGPTVTKWYNRECSLVDIPGNYNALTNLVDVNDRPINLSDFKIQNIQMEQITLTAAQVALIPNLKADAKQADVDGALTNLVAEAAKVPGLMAEVAAANEAKQTAETALAELKASSVKDNVAAQLQKAIDEKRITVEQKNLFAREYAEKPEPLKALLDTMKPFESIVGHLAAIGAGNDELKQLMDMKVDDLFKGDGAERLKEKSLPVFKQKYKEYTGKEYQEQK